MSNMEDLIRLAESLGIEPEDLDELVHDLKGGEAAYINDGGLRSQLSYIFNGVPFEAAAKELRDEIARRNNDG